MAFRPSDLIGAEGWRRSCAFSIVEGLESVGTDALGVSIRCVKAVDPPPSVRMSVSSEQHSWTATQVRVLAATGLASSHLHPFVRLLHNAPKSQGRRGPGRSRTLLVESREGGEDVICRRQRERSGKYTATWSSTNAEEFTVHSAVDWVELQLWNRFDNGFDVFLGKSSVSLCQLQQQCSDAIASDDGDSWTTGALWFPLRASEANGLASTLSLQVECVFTSDTNVRRIREELLQRRTRAAKKTRLETQSGQAALESGEDADERESVSVADPAFAFTQPFAPVEWSLIASTSVRQLFFHVGTHPISPTLYGTLLDSSLFRDAVGR